VGREHRGPVPVRRWRHVDIPVRHARDSATTIKVHPETDLKSNRRSLTTRNTGGNMIVRLYTGEDGQAHFEDLNVPAGDTETVDLQTGADMTYRRFPDGSFSDWHNAPRVQYVITLSGQMEIGIGDGTKRMFNPGDILQVEDLTGQGHTTRSVGERISASVALSV
jgi:hypothetical protein